MLTRSRSRRHVPFRAAVTVRVLMAPGLAALCLLALGCPDTVRTYDVLVDREELCRTFGSQPQSCGEPATPGTLLRVTIEDRWDGTALVTGRSDSSASRAYQATVPRPGRYEVVENFRQENSTTECVNTTGFILVLDVDDDGLDGAEETRTEESPECNGLEERRLTVRSRAWAGSRHGD